MGTTHSIQRKTILLKISSGSRRIETPGGTTTFIQTRRDYCGGGGGGPGVMCRMCALDNYEEVMMLEGEVACEVAELKIAAKNKMNDRIGSSDEENHEYGPINANKEDKELKGDMVISNIVGTLIDKNNTEKLNCEVGKNTDILSSKNESKIQDKNTENGNVAKTGPEDVGKKTGLAFFMDEVKIGDKNTESGTETKEMDKKSNIT